MSAAPEIYYTRCPAWLPESIRNQIQAGHQVIHATGFSRPERRVLRKRRKLPNSLWAEKHRWVRVSSREGQWSNQTTPYLSGIMDATGCTHVQDVTVCAAPQTGKTDMSYNCLGSWIDQDPGPAMVVFADEQTAKDELSERIETMIHDSPRLSQYKTAAARDMSSLRLALQHMTIHIAWATSVPRLATKPKRYVIFDEVDKYPDTLKKETDPISLGIKRTRTYPDDRKIIKISSPTWEHGPIWRSLTSAQKTFRYSVCCPECRHMQAMVFGEKDSRGGIKWPADERDPSIIETERLAWYQCEKCGSGWDDSRRDQAVLLGEWRCVQTGRELMTELQLSRPTRIGFHIPAWLSTFVSLSECAAAFLRGLSSKTLLRDFLNGYAAEPWMEYETERVEDQILELRDERPRGLVPSDAFCLTAAVDTQDDGFWYEIRAWGRGFALDSWQVREGFIPATWHKMSPEDLQDRQWMYHQAFDPLRRLLWEDKYLDAMGNEYTVALTAIDAMGHKTSEVYDFCRAHRGKAYPVQGMRNRSNKPYKYSKLDTYPGSNRSIPGGLSLLQLDVHHYKDELSGRLQISAMDPGAWRMHSETTRDWARHMCAEYLNEKKQRWECPSNRANHGWDCSVYNLALADILGIRFRSQQVQQKTRQKHSQRKDSKNPFTEGSNPFAR
ncbi:terminase gpA endonuclease subunit [Desulfonatronovibrio hydrogenovorans]|uniref:terminase gpA endonuclease subunit n=1 Tax=Desulfonatronovibrio hydrogenovorans TaxID=53245 RepID=UPI00068FF772|nr:terminase gpA endonuclease subunit [Desulfonatronovibrio hydrogenovorans]